MSWVPIPSYQQPAPKLTQPPSPLFLSHARFINKAHAPISGSPFAKSHKMTRQAYSAGKQTLLSPFMTQVAPIPIRRSRSTRSEEHTSELQSLMRTSYAVFCLKQKTLPLSIHHKLNTTN